MLTNTLFNAGSVSPLALMPSTLVVDGRGRLAAGVDAAAGTRFSLHQEKAGYTVSGQARTAQTTDLRGIPPRGPAPV